MKTKRLTLSKLIKKHSFDYVNSDINDKLFPRPKTISTDYKVFHFDRSISSENAIKDMENEGYHAANIYELLSFDWNKKDWVVALGSVAKVGGVRYVPSLGVVNSERSLVLNWFGYAWNSYCRFLAVSNSELGVLVTKKTALGNLDTMPLILNINGIEYKRNDKTN